MSVKVLTLYIGAIGTLFILFALKPTRSLFWYVPYIMTIAAGSIDALERGTSNIVAMVAILSFLALLHYDSMRRD